MKFKNAVLIFVGVIIILSIILALMGFNGETIDKVINLLIPIGLSLILSAFVGAIIERFSGDTLKKIFIVIPIWKFNVSVSLFVIATILIKIWLF